MQQILKGCNILILNKLIMEAQQSMHRIMRLLIRMTYLIQSIFFMDCSYLLHNKKGISNINHEIEIQTSHNRPDVPTVEHVSLHACLVLGRFND